MLNDIDMPGENGGTLRTNKLQDGDVINCRLTSSIECVFPEISNPIRFKVKPILVPDVNISLIYLGHNQHLFTAIPTEGGMNPMYQWYLNSKYLKMKRVIQ